MPGTVYHSLTATTPDNTSYEIRPSHWNSPHVLSLSLSGSEMIGGFSNAGNVSFALDGGGHVIGSVNFGGALTVSGNGSSIAAGELIFSNSNGVSFGMNGSTMTATVATNYADPNVTTNNIATSQSSLFQQTSANSNFAGTGTSFSGTNVSGSITLNSNGINLALSAGAGGGGGGIAAAAGGVTVSNNTLQFSNANGVTFGIVGSTITASIPAVGGAQTGISSVAVGGATYTSGSINFINSNSFTFLSTTGQGIVGSFSTSQSVQTQASGNIAGTGFATTTTAGAVPGGTLATNGFTIAMPSYLTTAAQSSASNVSVAYAATNNTGGGTATLSGGVSFSNANSLTFYTSAGNAIVASFSTSQSVQTQVSGNIVGVGFTTTTTAGSVLTGTHNSLGLSLAVPLWLTAAAGGGGFTGGVSTGGNTSGNTGSQTGSIFFAGGNNITLSVGTAAGGAQTITISGANAGGAQTGISSIAAGGTTYTSGSIQFVNSNSFTFLSTTGQGIVASFSYTNPTAYVSSVNGSSGAISLNVGSSLSSSVNGSSITFGLASNITTALQSAGAYLTTAAQSSVSNVSGLLAATNNTGGGTVTLSGNISFSNANSMTFYTSAGNAIVGSFSTSQSVQTQASGAIAGSGFTTTTTAGTAIVGTHDTSGLSIGVPNFLTGIVLYNTQLTTSSQITATALSFFQSNNMGFGFTNGGITGSFGNNVIGNVNSISGIRQFFFVTSGVGGAGNVTFNVSSNTITASAPFLPVADSASTLTNGTLVFSNANGVSFGLNGSTMTASVAAGGGGGFTGGVSNIGNTLGNTGTQTGQLIFAGGNNITLSVSTAAGGAQTITISGPNAGGAQTGISSIAGGGTTYTSGSIQFVNSNNFSFLSTTGQGFVGSFSQSVQTQASGNIVGSGFTSTTTAGVVPAGTLNSAGLSLAVPNWITTAAAQTVQPVAVSGSNGSFAFSTVTFGNLNGASFYTSNGSVVASYTVPTQTVQPVAFSASGGSSAFSTLNFANSNGFTFSNSNGSVIGSYTVPTVPTAYVSSVNGTSGAVSFAVGSSLSSSTVNGTTTFGLATNITTALQSAGAYLTTAMQSNTSLFVAATNNTGGGTASLSGAVSFSNANNLTFYTSAGNAIVGSFSTSQSVQTQASGNIAGVGTTYAGANVSASMTLNSLGLNLSASVAAPITTQAFYFVGNTTGQSSSSTVADQTISFSGAGIASMGWSAGQVIVSVPAGGGGGDGYNIISMMTSTSGGGTAGATFSALSASIGLMAGSNITLSQTSNTIVINGPSGGAGPTLSDWEPIPLGASTTAVLGQNTVYLQPLFPLNNISFSAIEVISNISISSSAIAGWTKGSTISYGLYAQDTGTRNTQITLLSSSSFAVNMTASSNASFMVSLSQGANSTTYSTAASIHSAVNGTKIVSLPFAGTVSAGGNYFLGFVQSSSTAGANVASTVGMLWNNEYVASFGALAPNTLGASAASLIHEPFGFIYATTSGALPGTVPNTAFSVTNNQQPYLFFEA